MKPPSCLVVCFGGCARPPSETESTSHFSVGKGPVPSGAVLSGFLSSFMSRRSGSRGTLDYSGSDAQKPRARMRGDADVVTLATARYLELFATSPKTDESSTVLSDVREPQDSMRSARTASENQVSRSSTLTGRASREPSRLGGMTQPPVAGTPSTLPVSSSPRFTMPFHRRGASDNAAVATPSGNDGSTVQNQGQSAPPYTMRRNGSMPHVSALSPFTNKIRLSKFVPSRSRSDRISPSTSAFLLPAPSIKLIARAQTALPAGLGCVTASNSCNDLADNPLYNSAEGGTGESGGAVAMTPLHLQDQAATSGTQAPLLSSATGGGFGRRSRLQTENGVSTPPAPAAPLDLGAAAQQWTGDHTQLTRSSTSVRRNGGTVRRALPRRPSILFTRDGDVTVTGLPPSCLTAGRAPRGRLEGPGSTFPNDSACMPHADVSVYSALLVAGGSVDGAGSRTIRGVGDGGGNRPGGRASGVYDPVSPGSIFPHSNDHGSRCCTTGSNLNTNTSNVARLATQPRRHGGAGTCGGAAGRSAGVSMSCGANAIFKYTDTNPNDSVIRVCNSNEQLEGFLELESDQPREERQQQKPGQEKRRPLQEQHDKMGQEERHQQNQKQGEDNRELSSEHKVHTRSPGPRPSQEQGRQDDQRTEQGHAEGSQVLVLANSSSEGQRCDWGGSSMYAPSRYSDSSRLTQANTTGAAAMTPAMASLHSNNPLDPCTSMGSAAIPSSSPAFPPRRVTSIPVDAARNTAMAVTATGAAPDGLNPDGGISRPSPPQAAVAKAPYGASGQSLLATEARDVTSALSRLQEACLAAVAQGDMRSQRLCRRVSTDLPRVGVDPSQRLMRIGAHGFGADRASNMGPSNMASSLGGVVLARTAGLRTGPPLSPSASLPRLPVDSTKVLIVPQSYGDGAAPAHLPTSQAGSVTLAMNVALHGPSPSATCAEEDAAAGGMWGPGGFGPDRASPEGAGIVIDGGKIIHRGRLSTVDASDDEGCEEEPEQAPHDTGYIYPSVSRPLNVADVFDEAGDEYRNRMLNVLLRSDFLHDTHDHGSDDDDDGVVEYRYGGFELGGGDHDCGFSRQASFMEAVRKCGMGKAAACAVEMEPSQAGASRSEATMVFCNTVAATCSRTGPTTLQRKGSCLKVSSLAQPARM